MQADKILEVMGRPGGGTSDAMDNFLDTGIAGEKFADYAKILPQLLSEHETIMILLRKNIKVHDEKMDNSSTIVFLTNLLKQHEDIAGILRQSMNKAIID